MSVSASSLMSPDSGCPSGKAATPTVKSPRRLTRRTSSSAWSSPSGWATHGCAEAALGVSAQGEDVAHAARGIRPDDAAQLGHGVPDAREVRHRRQRGLLEHALGEAHGAVAGAATRAVGDRHEAGSDLLEAADRVPELRLGGVVLGREELEAEGRSGSVDHGRDRPREACCPCHRGGRAVCHVAHDRATEVHGAWAAHGVERAPRRLATTSRHDGGPRADPHRPRRPAPTGPAGDQRADRRGLHVAHRDRPRDRSPRRRRRAAAHGRQGAARRVPLLGLPGGRRRRLRRPRAPGGEHGVLPGRGPAPRRRDGPQ